MFSLSGNGTFRPTLPASFIHTEILDISTGLLHPHRNFGFLHRSLTPTQKFGIAPRVSYTHTEIRDISSSLLHPHRNFEFLPGSLTPTQKFWDIFLGLLHPHRNFRFLHGSLTPTQKFRISPRVSYTHTEISGYLPGSLTPYLQAFSLKGINLLCPTH